MRREHAPGRSRTSRTTSGGRTGG